MAVFDGHKPLDESLDKFARKYDLSAQDKSFAHALCGFVLRYKPALQSAVNKAANRQTDLTPSSLNTLVVMGAAQIYLMDSVPDHAAVDTSVTLASLIKCDHQKGLVNAVLRRLIREERPPLRPSLPRWLFKTWEKDYGLGIAKEIETASLQQAKTGVTHKNGEWRIIEGDLNLSSDEWVQDYASAMPVSLLGNLSGKTVLDLCAAPGGKTMQMAAMDANVTAVDISAKRLERLKDNLNRTGLTDQVEVICADILKWSPNHTYDVVLLDAPCSATGTIRRHPDLPYIRTQKDIESLVTLQVNLLDRVKGWVKRDGGQLIYCTCSLQKIEGEYQAQAFLDRHSDCQRLADDVRLMPQNDHQDGFFIARFGWR